MASVASLQRSLRSPRRSVDIDYFTDAFRLDGEGEFSFRANNVDPEVLKEFQARAGRWVATYRELSAQVGRRPSSLSIRLELKRASSFEDVWSAAEELRSAWNLGDVPAATLDFAIQRELGALVLHVDAPKGIFGAAIRLPGANCILINRQEPVGRRSFDLAHELFHLLTWEAMPPALVEPREPKKYKGNRVELLAENFAAALLMPRDVLADRWRARGNAEIHDWLNATATWLRVSASALKGRLINLGYLSVSDLSSIQDDRLVANGGGVADPVLPPLFNAEFVQRMHSAVETGRFSLRRAAKLASLSPSGFADLCRQYGLPLSYDDGTCRRNG